MKLTGSTLHVNADASQGYLLAEILEVVDRKPTPHEPQWSHAIGAPLQDHTRNECNPVTVDSLDHTITWHGNSDISRLENKLVVLKFYLKNCSLYGFKISE